MDILDSSDDERTGGIDEDEELQATAQAAQGQGVLPGGVGVACG
jgi:hypothetical protein